MQVHRTHSVIISILQYVLIALHGLCLAIAVGHAYLEVPLLLEVFGRAHPLILHFPIVLLLLLAVLLWDPKTFAFQNQILAQVLFLLTLCMTGLTVLAGLFLAAESGYNVEEFFTHQWVSMGVFWIASSWYWAWSRSNRLISRLGSVGTIVLTLLAGHLGASITHGEDFLWAPFQQKTASVSVSLEEAMAFDHVILPILEQKCVSCHKASKQKGELRLDGAAFVLAGGKTGPVLDADNPGLSPLLQRILLPLEHEEHMPPKGKVQLTPNEIELIRAWIEEKAPMDKSMLSLEDTSIFFQLAKQTLLSNAGETYSFPFAPAGTIAKLSNDFRVIQSIHPGSPALQVSFFGKGNYKSEQLDELGAIREQVVTLNLSNMPLEEEDLQKLRQFINLEKLFLNGTGIRGVHIDALTGLKSLKTLSLTGNLLEATAFEKLGKLSQVDAFYLWNTGINEVQTAKLSSALPHAKIDLGHRDDGRLYQLNAPMIQAVSGIFQEQVEVSIKHPISGVGVFYTLNNTAPDSSNYQLYTNPLSISKNAHLRVRAFADGWLGSEEAEAVFFKAGIKPQKYQLTFPPHDSYKGNGVETLFDLEKGDEDFASGKWLGFQNTDAELILDLEPGKVPHTIAFSLLSAVSFYIFPPLTVEIWSKGTGEAWVLLHRDKPEQPITNQERKQLLLEYSLPSNGITQIKAILKPVNSLPTWHPGAGQRGWVFLDEVLVN